MNEIADEIVNKLKELGKTNIIFKVDKYGIMNFYYSPKHLKQPKLLSGCVENNFKKDNKFYVGVEKMVAMLKSDYDYAANFYKH